MGCGKVLKSLWPQRVTLDPTAYNVYTAMILYSNDGLRGVYMILVQLSFWYEFTKLSFVALICFRDGGARGGWGDFSPPLLRRMTFYSVLVYGTYKEIKKTRTRKRKNSLQVILPRNKSICQMKLNCYCLIKSQEFTKLQLYTNLVGNVSRLRIFNIFSACASFPQTGSLCQKTAG